MGLMLSFLLVCNTLLELPKELWSMHSKLNRFTMISTIGLWSLKLGIRFHCPPRIKDSLALSNCNSI